MWRWRACVDPAVDPEHCGGCGDACDDREYCTDSDCVCRPGLSLCGDGDGQCVDTESDPQHCGECDNPCGDTCQNGECQNGCDGGRERCGDACVDTDESPIHCGECFNTCDVDEVCVSGDCEEFRDSRGCDECPCATCAGELSQCCAYPGSDQIICINSDECP
jgi:hypothetical protein